MDTILDLFKLRKKHFEADYEKLERGASLHKKYSNITFKIVKVEEEAITVRTEQGEHLSENYADVKTLIRITRELFEVFFPDKMIYIHPLPYSLAPTAIVSPEWVNQKMLANKINVEAISQATGLSKKEISAWINGTEPMSPVVQAMFYFYFK